MKLSKCPSCGHARKPRRKPKPSTNRVLWVDGSSLYVREYSNKNGRIHAWVENGGWALYIPGQYDQQSLPPYDILDAIIHGYVEDRWSEDDIAVSLPHVDRAVIHKVLGLIDRAEYKRQQAAPTIKVTSKAWYGRFMPIAKKSLYR